MDTVQTGLDVGGLTPGIGIFADGLNTVISLGRGDWVSAGLNAMAMIPVVGQGTKEAQLGGKIAKAVDKGTDFAKPVAAKVAQGFVAGTRGLEHSYGRHAAEWFARHGGTASLAKWQKLIESAAKSKKVVNWSVGSVPTTGHLARIDGNKFFFVQFFKDGGRAGELATAFIPNKHQLRAILELLGK